MLEKPPSKLSYLVFISCRAYTYLCIPINVLIVKEVALIVPFIHTCWMIMVQEFLLLEKEDSSLSDLFRSRDGI